jgi:DNA-binding transcriptional LysR family regulator
MAAFMGGSMVQTACIAKAMMQNFVIHRMNMPANRPLPDSQQLLDTFDLNLLRVFDVLMQERKVVTAARRLNLSQPAVSNALGRLRRALGDELLTRTPAGMQCTAYAQGVHDALAPALKLIEQSLQSKAGFDAVTQQWRARLAMTDIGEIVFMPPLLAHLRTAAPGLTLSTVRNTAIDLPREMASGTVDLALGWLPDVPQGFYQRRLFTQRYVCLARAGHPLVTGTRPRLTIKKFLQAEHIAVLAEGTGHTRADATLQKLGVSRKVVLQVPHFLSVPYLVAQSDLLVTVPERLAQAAAPAFGLQVLAHPVAMPAFEVNLFWHRRVHQDPANQWLRAYLAKEFGK